MQTKICGSCKLDLEINKFGKDKHRADGLNWKCKACNTNSAKKTYSERMSKNRYKKVSSKNCWDCKTILPISNFNKDRATADGHKNICRECCLIRIRDWERNNPDKARVSSSKSRAKRRQNASSPLSSYFSEDIWVYYFVASDFSLRFGIKYHVDHVVPLCGTNVCGLHVPWNMRVITSVENQTKNNKLVGDLIDLSASAYRGLTDEQKTSIASGW